QEIISAAQLCYAGGSVLLTRPVAEDLLLSSLRRLCNVKTASKQKVLTVDDDEVLTNFIAGILSTNGLAVRTLNKPILILEVMQEFKPDLVLLDVMMPGLSGYDVCRMLRASEEFGSVPIIFITSKSDREGRAAAFQAGGDDFLSKPVLAEELTARVLSQLELAVSRKKVPAIDSITGVYSRSEFLQETGKLLVECQQASVNLSVCLLTIDEFASMSTVHSMFGAEQALASLGQLLKCHFKADVLRGRWSEGGFALAFPDESPDVVAEAVGLMLQQFADIKLVSSTIGSFKSTFSAGLAGSFEDGDNVEALINTAYLRLVRGRQQKVGAIAYVG
ncbi:MAG TPA: response regulator, partial [Chroococcales cyanobacterium]